MVSINEICVCVCMCVCGTQNMSDCEKMNKVDFIAQSTLSKNNHGNEHNISSLSSKDKKKQISFMKKYQTTLFILIYQTQFRRAKMSLENVSIQTKQLTMVNLLLWENSNYWIFFIRDCNVNATVSYLLFDFGKTKKNLFIYLKMVHVVWMEKVENKF